MRARNLAMLRLAPAALALSLCLGGSGWSGTASAQSASSGAAAQVLFDEARQLMSAGKYTEACPKLEESQRLDPGSGTLLNLAECYARLGQVASAWGRFVEAEGAARQAGNAEREKAAHDRAAALAPRLPKIVIQVAAGGAPGLEIRRDGEIVGQAQWGVGIPADPGPHSIVVSAPGRKPWQTQVTLQGDASIATVAVPELAVESAQPAPAPLAVPIPTEPARASSPGLGVQRTLALASGGVGVVGVVVGTVFGLQSQSKHKSADGIATIPRIASTSAAWISGTMHARPETLRPSHSSLVLRG